MACTINEPNVVATMGWRLGIFPPRVRDRVRRDVVNRALVSAHRKGVEAIRSASADIPVGLTLSMVDFQLRARGRRLGRADAATIRGRLPRGHRG